MQTRTPFRLMILATGLGLITGFAGPNHLALASVGSSGSAVGLVVANPTNPSPRDAVKSAQVAAAPAAEAQANLVHKLQMSREHHLPPVPSSQLTVAAATTASTSTYQYLAANQQAQITSYYCGPAATTEALGAIGIGTSQNAMASMLGTTTSGTGWGSGTSGPVQNTLNSMMDSHFGWDWYYYGQYVNYYPSSSDYANYNSNLVFDVNNGFPLVGNAWEVPGGPHLVGHPMSYTIYHWFEIRGYTNGGSTTAYEDSVAGATSISWYQSVPPYSWLASSTIVQIIGGRGYVW